ncbi:MAG: insulinase family protein [Clostridia bacterium]|nr:insulinase family protein [Clostridia bacterium]
MKFYQDQPRVGVVCNYGIADHFKTGYLSVDFVLPLTLENATGMSLLAGVISRGCKEYPRMDLISRYLARNYGASFSINANKAGELEILTFSFTYLNNEYAIDGEDIRGAVLALFREMVFHPLVENGGFLPEYVEQEKANHADKIKGIFNDKRVYSLERCKELMCRNEAFGIHDMGNIETLEGFDHQSLYAFFQKMMADAHVVISYVGKEQGHFLTDLADGFSAREDAMPQTFVCPQAGETREIVEPMDLNQSKLNLGFRLGDAALQNGAACRLFNLLYGGSATSKLFLNVRERLSLCYYCSSSIDRFKNVMFVSSGVEADKYEEARKEIEAQLAAIAEGAFTEEEFANAKAYLVDSIYGLSDSEGALASLMLSGTLRGVLKTPEQEIEEIQRVERETVIEIAKSVTLDTVYFLKGVHNEE